MYPEINVKKFYKDAIIPTYANPGDAGADLYSVEHVELHPGNRYLIDTGVGFEIPEGWVGLVHPRSGLATRLGVTVLNAPGTVDSGYRGKVMVNLINHGSAIVRISKGDRIAQIVFQKVATVSFFEVDDLNDSIRGAGGHGSTGVLDGRV